MSTTQQPEALRLAELCDNFQKLEKIGTELRRQHARIAELEAQLSATNPIQQGLDAQTTRDAVIQHLTSAGVLEHDGCGTFIASGDASELIVRAWPFPPMRTTKRVQQRRQPALLATGGQAQAVERIAIDMKQTAELLDLFGGEPTEFTVMQCNGHSGPGLYAYVTEYPEDGASHLGKTDCEAQPAPQAQAAASTTGHGLEQFIEQVGDVHFQRCRIGSKEGAIRWDIELGHYGAEVRGKTLREAITKAIAAQAKKGKQ